MTVIAPFIDSPGVVENGEKLNHLWIGSHFIGKPRADFQNPRPMGNAMRPVDGQDVIFEDGVNEGLELEHGMNYFSLLRIKNTNCRRRISLFPNDYLLDRNESGSFKPLM